MTSMARFCIFKHCNFILNVFQDFVLMYLQILNKIGNAYMWLLLLKKAENLHWISVKNDLTKSTIM